MNSCASAARQACSICALVAFGRPMRRFSRIERLNSRLSWNTMPMVSRRLSSVACRMSWPSIATRPPVGSHSRCSRFIAVLLPAPVEPTSAITLPGCATKDTWDRIAGPPG